MANPNEDLSNLTVYGSTNSGSFTSINNAGNIVGVNDSTNNPVFVVVNGITNAVQNPPGYAAGDSVLPPVISNDLTSFSYEAFHDPVVHNYINESGTFFEIDPAIPAGETIETSVITGISSDGTIVGVAEATDGKSYYYITTLGSPTDLLPVPGPVTGVNAGSSEVPGVVIGDVAINSNLTDGYIYQNGTVTDVQYENATITNLLAINDNGDIIGDANTTTSRFGVATQYFIDQNGTITDINAPTNLDAGGAWGVSGFNNQGEIVGFEQVGGQQVNFTALVPTATPAPTPTPVVTVTGAGDTDANYPVGQTIAPFQNVRVSDTNGNDQLTAKIVVGSDFNTLAFRTTFRPDGPTPGHYILTTSATQLTFAVDSFEVTTNSNVEIDHTDNTIQLTITSGTGAVEGAARLTVNPTPAPTPAPSPTALHNHVTVNLGETIQLPGSALAVVGRKGDSLTVIADLALKGQASVQHNDLVYMPGGYFQHLAANATATDTVAYTVKESDGKTVDGELAVTVTNVAKPINGPQYGSGTINGSSGTDVINAYGYNNKINDNGGNDIVNAGQGQATVNTGSGDVVVNLNGYNNTVTGGDGWMTVKGGQGNLTVKLGNGNDTITANGYNNVVTAGSGKDLVTGIAGNATVKLGDGGDSITASGYNNKLITGAGNDWIQAGDGNEIVSSGAGDDTIFLAGYGNVVDAGTSYNMIFINGGGNDTFVVHAGGNDVMHGFTSSNSIFDLRSVISENNLHVGSFASLSKYFAVTSVSGHADLVFSGSGNIAHGYTVLADLGIGTGIASLSDLNNHGELRFS